MLETLGHVMFLLLFVLMLVLVYLYEARNKCRCVQISKNVSVWHIWPMFKRESIRLSYFISFFCPAISALEMWCERVPRSAIEINPWPCCFSFNAKNRFVQCVSIRNANDTKLITHKFMSISCVSYRKYESNILRAIEMNMHPRRKFYHCAENKRDGTLDGTRTTNTYEYIHLSGKLYMYLRWNQWSSLKFGLCTYVHGQSLIVQYDYTARHLENVEHFVLKC